MHVNIDTPGHPRWIWFVQRTGLICSAAHHFGATTFGLFWIISFEFVKVFWTCFSSWERFIGFLADASLRGRRKTGRGRGWGREKSAKEGKRGKGNLPLFSSSLSPTPFDACYTGWLMLNTISRMLAFLFAVGIPETLGILQIATAIAIYLRQLYITNNTTKHCRTLYCHLEKEKKRGRKRERKKDELRELKQSTKWS